jgi:hypothetical protein
MLQERATCSATAHSGVNGPPEQRAFCSAGGSVTRRASLEIHQVAIKFVRKELMDEASDVKMFVE